MDLTKIGKYIAAKRKDLGMTQKELAEKLRMSDKSVSKWERGVCLPDVSVYAELCQILGISINEFLAGEDIAQENYIKKSEENIIGVATDSIHKQKYLKRIIYVLLVVFAFALAAASAFAFWANRPQNYMAPVEQNSIEMETVNLLAGPDGAYIYKFRTTSEYNQLKLYISEYQSDKQIRKDCMNMGFDGVKSPQGGEVILIPDFTNFVIKLVISADGTKLSTEIPILEDVANRETYGRAATGIRESTQIQYNEEQELMAFVYDKDEMWVPDLSCFAGEPDKFLSENDFTYYISFEFCSE